MRDRRGGIARARTTRERGAGFGFDDGRRRPRRARSAAPTTITCSPRGRHREPRPPGLRRGCRARPPRSSLVTSRTTATARSGPHTARRSASVAPTRCGDSNSTTVTSEVAIDARRSVRAATLAGRNPSKRKRAVGRPDSTSAASAALGPGTTSTAQPASMHARTRSSPGSAIPGIPASLTYTTRCAALDRVDDAAAPRCVRCARARRATGHPTGHRPREQSARVRRVSSAAITSALRNSSTARGDRSPRLPIGVATNTSAGRGDTPAVPGSSLHLDDIAELQPPTLERARGRFDREVGAPDRDARADGAAGSSCGARSRSGRRTRHRSRSAYRWCGPGGTAGSPSRLRAHPDP